MKRIIIFACLFLFPYLTMAQQPGGRRGGGPGGMPSSGQAFGKVVDAATGKGIGFATIGLLRGADSTVVAGVLSKENGDFNLEKLAPGPYILRINFIGYNTVYHNFNLTSPATPKDLGNFKLVLSTSTLKTVNVTAEKSAYSMGIDKKVFDVTKSLTSVGGNAIDVMKQVPSVDVDIDGNVTVRNGSPTIFVDGKRTTLTLEEIPAESIEKIEVITNPSAKYDAEGMSGIINIVLKKNRKPGINGRLQAGADTRGGYNAGGNLNLYRNPFNLSLSYFLNARKGPYTGVTDRHNLFDDSFLHQSSDGARNGHFQMGRIGLDYFLDNRNTLSIEGGMGGGSFGSTETLNSTYLNGGHGVDSTSNRDTRDKRTFRFYSGDLSYKHTFKKDGHLLTADFTVRKSDNGGNGRYETQFYDNTGKPMFGSVSQKNNTDGSNTFYSGQIDYVNPLTEKAKLEAGLKGTVRNFNSVYDVFDLDLNNDDYIFNGYLSSDYKFDENIYAGYVQFSNQLERFGYQLGLRAEQYGYDGAIPSKDLTFSPEKDKLGLYPSAFLTYKITDMDQLQLNYTRRVERPRFWDRIPYTDYSDPQNLRKGNPDLKPEYTNSFEFSYNKLFGQSNFLATIYFRNTVNAITEYSEPFNNSPDTLIRYAINAETNNAYGTEFTLQTQLAKWWTVTANLNLFQTDISAAVNTQSLSNQGFTWFAKLNTQIKLPADFSVQLDGRYSGPQPRPQGTSYRYGGLDLGLRKDLFKKKASVTLGLSDVFNSEKFKSVYDVPDVFTQTSLRRRQSRALRVNFSYTFGKQDMQLFRRKANKSSQQNQDGGGMQDSSPDDN